MTAPRFDHVALEVDRLEHHIEILCRSGLLRLLRMGSLGSSGQRIAMLGDGTGVKVELIEAPGGDAPKLAHLAFAVADVDHARSDLLAQGWAPVRGPNELTAAKARSALLRDAAGLHLQVVSYQPDSVDLTRWTTTSEDPAATARSTESPSK